MKKYLAVFKLSWQIALEYRFDFAMGQIRDLLFLLTTYFFWVAVFRGRKVLFGFDDMQIVTYVLGATLISAFVFDYAMDRIADGISKGELSVFLLKPINYIAYHQLRRLATTLFSILLTVGELTIFLILLKPKFFLQADKAFLLLALFSFLLAILIFMIIDSLVGVLSFWALYAYGPRFALKMFMELTSGRIFPLNVLPLFLFRLIVFLPFSYLVYFPLNIYLGRLPLQGIIVGLITQVIWVLVLLIVLRSLWSRGLKIYEAVGI